jgi:hypothetical protein
MCLGIPIYIHFRSRMLYFVKISQNGCTLLHSHSSVSCAQVAQQYVICVCPLKVHTRSNSCFYTQ